MWQSGGFWRFLPFPNVFCRLFYRCKCEINPIDLWNISSFSEFVSSTFFILKALQKKKVSLFFLVCLTCRRSERMICKMDSLEIPSRAQARRRLLYMCISLAACLNCVSGRISAVTDRLHLRGAPQPPVAWRGSIPSSLQAVDLSRLEKSAARVSAQHNSLLNWKVIFSNFWYGETKVLSNNKLSTPTWDKSTGSYAAIYHRCIKKKWMGLANARMIESRELLPGLAGRMVFSFLPFFLF